MTGPRYDLLREEEDRWDRIRREEDEAEANRKGFARTLADQGTPDPGGVSSGKRDLFGRSLRTLNQGDDLGPLTVTAKNPNTIASALAIGAADPGTPEGRAIAAEKVRKAVASFDNTKRFAKDLAFSPLQFSLGAASNATMKGDALLGGFTESPEEWMRRNDPRGRSWGDTEDKGALAPLRKRIGESSQILQEAGGAIPYLQLGSNIAGNMATELAAFRASGKAVGAALPRLAQMYEGTQTGRRFANLDRLSKLANDAKGARGAAMRVGRDFASNLPVNTLNASDRNLSSAGGGAMIGEMAGGDRTKRPTGPLGLPRRGNEITGWLDRIADSPAKRQLFENALDVGLGGGIEALLGVGKGAKRALIESSDQPAREIGDALAEAGADANAARRRPGAEWYAKTPQAQTVKVEPPPAAAASPEPAALEPPPAALEPPVETVTPPADIPPAAPRRAAIPLRPLRPTSLRFSDGTTEAAHYAYVELDDLLPSHDPFSYRPSEGYPERVQGRDYEHDPAAQASNQGKAANLDREKLLDPTWSPERGPPTITQSGVVVSGTDRAMAMKRAAMQFPDRWAAYRQGLDEFGPAYYGAEPGAAEGMKNPVLVRVLDDADEAPERLSRLNQVSDASDMKRKRALDAAAGKAGLLRNAATALEHLNSTMAPEETVSEYLKGAAGRGFVTKLVDDGVITSAELPALVDVTTHTLTEEGRDLIRETLLVAALDDIPLISRAPASVLGNLEHAIPAILATRGTAWDIAPAVREAIDALTRARALGMPVDGLLSQVDVLTGNVPEYSAAGGKLARFLEQSGKTNTSQRFRSYATMARETAQRAESGDMFGGTAMTAEQAMDQLFGVKPKAASGEINFSPNLFDDPNIGRIGQQEMFDSADLTAPRKIPPAPGGGAPELPGGISAEEMAARHAELGSGNPEIPGSKDPRQQVMFSPAVKRVVGNATQIPAPSTPVPVMLAIGDLNAPVGIVDPAAGEGLADVYKRTRDDVPPRNRIARGPVSSEPVVDAQGHPIPKAMAKSALMDFSMGIAGAAAGGAAGDDLSNRIQLAAAGGIAGLAGSKGLRAAVEAARKLAAGPTPEMKSMHRMVEGLRDGFDITTRSGMRWWAEVLPGKRKEALGYFATGEGGKRLIRLRSAADAETMFHEVGHALENDFAASLKAPRPVVIHTASTEILNELYGLGRALYPAGESPSLYLSEGFAEWVSRYVRGQDMDKLAPNASRALNQMLDANPKQRAAVEAAKREFSEFLAGTPEDRAIAQLAGVGSPESSGRKFLRDWYDQHIDTKEALRAVGIDPEKIRGVSFKDNAYTILRRADKANGVAENVLHQGVYDEQTGTFVTRPLNQVFQALTKDEIRNEFEPYMFAERTLELNSRFYERPGLDAMGNPAMVKVYLDPVDTGMNLADARELVDKYRERYESLAEIVWEHQAAMIDQRVRSGMMKPREADRIKETNQKHVPLYARFNDMYERVAPRGSGGASGGALYRIKGSLRNKESPLESLLADTFRTYQSTMRYQALDALIRTASKSPDGAKILTVLQYPPVERTELVAQEAAKQLQKLGWDVGYDAVKEARKNLRLAAKDAERVAKGLEPKHPDIDVEAAQDLVDRWEALEDQVVFEYSTIERPTAADQRELVMPVRIGGERKWIQVHDRALYEAINGLNPAPGSKLPDELYDVARGLTTVFRQSAVLTPAFIKRNPMRDAWSAFRRTNKEGMPIIGEHLIRGLGVMLNHYAHSAPTGPLPPPGASRVLAQIGRQADRAARAAIRTNTGTAAVGAAIGAATGDSGEERIWRGLAGAAIGAGVGQAAKNASTDVVDLYDMWMAAGGGGVSLAGLDINDHARTLQSLARSTVEKNIGIFHPIEALRSAAQVSEMANRLGELQIVMRQQLAKGASMTDARAAALHSAAEVTQDFTKGGRLSMAWNQTLPFFNASVVGKIDLLRDMKDPVRMQRLLMSVGATSVALWALQHDDPEYQDTEQHYKDNGWVLVWPPKFVRDLGAQVKSNPQEMDWLTPGLRSYLEEQAEAPIVRHVVPKPFESGVMVGSVFERALESLKRATDKNPETDPSQAGGLMYKPLDLLWNLVMPSALLPPMGQAAVDIIANEDYADRPIVPEYLKNAPAEEQATNRTGETARLLARATGVGAAKIEHQATGTFGPLAQVPIGISDAVIRRAREMAGKSPMRVEPAGGFPATPTSWGRAFDKGEISGGGAAVSQFYETLEKAQGKWKSYSDAPDGSDRKRELSKDPLVQLYRTEGRGALRAGESKIRKLRDQKKAALKRGDQEKARNIDREITLEARRIMRSVARAKQ